MVIPVSTSQIRIVLSKDPLTIRCPLGEQLRDVTGSACPTHCNGGAGHDDNFPLCTLIALVNRLLKRFDKGDWEGRKGPVEI